MKSVIAMLCASAALVAPAFGDITNKTVVTADLYYDHTLLSTPEGAAETFETLVEQAKEYCKVELYGFNRSDRKCVAEMTTDAVEQINSPMLTAVYEGTTLPITLASK